jgi:uncharacterized surface protein with fasciclin (FAS1) repeats
MNPSTLLSLSAAGLLLVSGLAVSAEPGACPLSGGNNAEARHHAPSAGTITEVAAAAGNFKTLVTALKAADLADTLNQRQGPLHGLRTDR